MAHVCTPEGQSKADDAMTAAARRLLSGRGEVRRFPGGATLATQGEPVDHLFLILGGVATAFRRFEGEEVPVSELGPGVLVGLEGACGTGRHGLSVVALGPVETVQLARPIFLDVLREDPEAALLVFTTLAGRLRACISDTDDLRFSDATSRMASRLVGLCENKGKGKNGSADITLPMSKKLLACDLGITQQSLSRVLRHLREEGVTVRGRRVHITDVVRLSALIERKAR